MPITQLNTTWEPEQLFTQSLMAVSNDANWMVQSQSDNSLILRREPAFGVVRWLILIAYGLLVVFTLGLGLLLMPFLGFLFIGRSAQQIAINTRAFGEGNTQATINYTKGATKTIRNIIDFTPRA